MVTRPKSKRSEPEDDTLDLNRIVAYNFYRARKLRDWTQDEAAEELERFLGKRLPQSAISSIENAYQGKRQREFDAHEIMVFALAFDLPIVYFFLPRPEDQRKRLRDSSLEVGQLYQVILGREEALGPVYDRLRELGIREPDELERDVEYITGSRSEARELSYKERRKEFLLAMIDKHVDRLDKAADEMGRFFDHVRQVGVRGFLAETLMDDDFTYPPENRAKRSRPAK
jgi:transcriptional regulator with XRE-family HTH domain